MSRRLFKNARLLDPASGLDGMGAVLVDGDEILDIGPGLVIDTVQEDVDVIDCGGHCLAPGLVDMRVQTREPGDEYMETLQTASEAALAGGVTTFVCLPNTEPIIDEIALMEYLERRVREIDMVDIHTYAAATKGLKGEEMSELGLLARSGALGFTDAERAISNALVMRRLLSYSSIFKKPIIQHPEEPTLASEGCLTEGETATRLGLSGIPAAAEVIMVERDLRLLEISGGHYHVAHVSTADAIDAIRRAKAKGLNVTADTAPHYFALNDSAAMDYRTFAKVSPPLRSEDDRLAVIAGLADGTIDAIASDHAPRAPDSKRLPFADADIGVIGLETLLVLTLELVHRGEVSLLNAIAALSHRPSQILGLEKGVLSKGADADFVIFDLNIADRIDVDSFRSKSKNSPFDGRPVQGRVLKTVRRGRVAFDRDAA